MKYNSIGKIVASHGLQGELIIRHRLGRKTALRGLKTIFVEVKPGEMLPYFIERSKARNDTEVILKLEGINSKEAVRELLQKEVWLPEEVFHEHASASAPISFLGFHLVHEGQDLGEILEVIEQPNQLLCRIDLQGREALIPVHEQTLEKIDKKGKRIFVTLPDGLLDIYR